MPVLGQVVEVVGTLAPYRLARLERRHVEED
jgi:hypothetical protein